MPLSWGREKQEAGYVRKSSHTSKVVLPWGEGSAGETLPLPAGGYEFKAEDPV